MTTSSSGTTLLTEETSPAVDAVPVKKGTSSAVDAVPVKKEYQGDSNNGILATITEATADYGPGDVLSAYEISKGGSAGLMIAVKSEQDGSGGLMCTVKSERDSKSSNGKGRSDYLKKWREAKALDKQVEIIGKVSADDGSTPINYWKGDMKNGGFVSVNMLSVVGDVKVYGSKDVIRGAIGKTDTGDVIIVPEERMKRNIQVYVGPQFIPATQVTGFIPFDGITGGVKRFALVNYFGRSVWQEESTITTHVPLDRRRKNPNRDLSKSDTMAKHLMEVRKDKISFKQKIAVMDLMCLHDVNISDARHSGVGTCDIPWCYHCLEDASKYCGCGPNEANQDEERICMKSKDILQDFQGYIGPTGLTVVSQLIEEGNDEAAYVVMWHNLETFKEMMKRAVDDRFCTYYHPRDVDELKAELEQRWEDSEQGQMNNRMKDYFVLTMTFEKLSCKRPGNLNASKVAGVRNGTFYDLCNARNDSKIRAMRKPHPKLAVQNKKVCQREGCTTFAHRSCGTFCYRHMEKKKLPMCINCQKKPSRKAKLCHLCLKDNEDKNKPNWCIVCRVRQARAINSRCGECSAVTKKCSSCGTAVIKIEGKCRKCFESEGGKRKRCNRCDKNLAVKAGLCKRCHDTSC